MISLCTRFNHSHAENKAPVAPETRSIGSSLFEIHDVGRTLQKCRTWRFTKTNTFDDYH